jgi:CHAT domain-containing protein
MLRLSEDAGLMVSDILALPRVPHYVTLFACESGRTTEEWGNLEGLGLAQAFLTRGSKWVVGTARPVAPGLAAAMSTSFYEAFSRSQDPAQAIGIAIRRVQPVEPQSSAQLSIDNDVGAFRVYVP